MEDDESLEREAMKQSKIKQQITIPFTWEESPGAPKKDWQPKCQPSPPAPRPVKYVASVPFKWEEKPGTPLQCFTDESKEPHIPETVPENRSLPLPPAFFASQYEYNDSDEDSSYDDDSDWISELASEAVSVRTEESFINSMPLQNPFVSELEETPGSPESCSSPNKYEAGGAASLRGATFLEYLFPLIPPKSDPSEDKIPIPERESSALAGNKKLGGDCRRSGAFRRPLTLQELIMLSRRSCRRKSVHMKKQNPSKEFASKSAQGCFSFGATGGGLGRLFGKDFPTLKLY